MYVDNDPLVLSHARALLVGTREGLTGYIDADLRDHQTILAGARKSLDFDRPVALMLMGILGYMTEADKPYEIVRALMDPLPSGSYLVVWDGSNVVTGEALDKAQGRPQRRPGARPTRCATAEEISRFFDGLELVEPGVVPITQWRPDPDPFGPPKPVDALVGVARKP